MIGHFADARAAADAGEAIDRLKKYVENESQGGEIEIGGHTERYPTKLFELLKELKIFDVSPLEVEQFGYEFSAEVKGGKVVLTTDESDVSAFLKIFIDCGARVEVYSAHQYPDSEHGRGK